MMLQFSFRAKSLGNSFLLLLPPEAGPRDLFFLESLGGNSRVDRSLDLFSSNLGESHQPDTFDDIALLRILIN